MKNDYYETLGVSKDASQDEIKKAFRKRAMECHPDRKHGDKECEEQFKQVNEAYSCLSDPQKRANYDRFGSAEGAGAGAGFGGFDAGFGDIFENVFGDLFGSFTGRRGSRGVRGSDLRYDMDITLEEAAFGVEKTLDLPSHKKCEKCTGTGSVSGKPEKCKQCGGAGQVRYQQGFFNVSRTCPQCRGEGTVIKDPCPECKGRGSISAEKSISVKIPAGVDSGLRLKMSGEGEPGSNGGPSGDLFIVLNVLPHDIFVRDGQEIYFEVPLGFSQAVLGAEFEVKTLDGTHKLKIPAGTQPGEKLHIKGKGIVRMGGRARGDQIAVIKLNVPKKATQRQREILEEFDKISDEEGQSLKSKIKNMFAGAG